MAIRKFKPSSPDKALGKIKGDTEFARLGHLNRLIDDINSEISSTDTILEFKSNSIGSKVFFSKANYADETVHKDVIIPGVLELARGNSQGLYNAAIDSSYQNPGPANTEWSSQYIDPSYTNWAPLWNLSNRTFDNWKNAIQTPEGNNAAPLQVGMPMLLRETTTGRLWLIMFTEWTHGGYGGGFAYNRWEILSSVDFEKPDHQTEVVDKISSGVWLARQDNGPLYNAVYEKESVVGLSPKNTRWNSEYTDSRSGYYGFDTLSNLESRVYTDFALALDYNVGANILNTDLIMHDLTTDLYYKFQFTDWTSGNNGGGFVYTRTVIPQSNIVKFADGSVMNTAATSSSSTGTVDSEGNLIIGDSSNDTITVGPGETHLIPEFSGMVIVNDHLDGGVETWICGGGDCTRLNYTSAMVGNSTFTQNGNGYEWTNVDNLGGPFTFTVIKTRNTA